MRELFHEMNLVEGDIKYETKCKCKGGETDLQKNSTIAFPYRSTQPSIPPG